jgi:hypothetical protein
VSDQPPGRLAAAAGIVKGLTLGNVLVIALLVVIAIPAYLAYKMLNDPAVMDRLMSSYKELPNGSGCILREVKERGGPDQWAISTGFAFRGADRWYVAVGLTHAPSEQELTSHCEALKRITDTLVQPP